MGEVASQWALGLGRAWAQQAAIPSEQKVTEGVLSVASVADDVAAR